MIKLTNRIVDNLQAAQLQFEAARKEFEAVFANSDEASINDLCRTFYYVRSAYEDMEEVRKSIGERIERLSRDIIPTRMQAESVKTTTLSDIGRRFTISTRVSASIPDKEAGYQWLRDTGNGSLITETVNSSTLSAFAKNKMEDGEELPNCFKISTMFTTSMTKV